MTLKKYQFVLIGLSTTLLMTACSQAGAKTANRTKTTDSSISTTTNTTYFSDKDFNTQYDETTATKINLLGDTVSVSGDGVSTTDSIVTISKAGTYIISGESNGLQLKVDADKEADIHIILKGVTMNNTNAPINVQKANSVTITLVDGTTNTLVDSSENSDEKANAVLFSKVDLIINGNGILNIDAKKNNGIKANDTLHITGGTYHITAIGSAFNVNDEFNITHTKMSIDAKNDAVKVDNDEDLSVGNMFLSDNTMTINAGDDGIHASGNLVIESGTYVIENSTEGIEGRTITIQGGDIKVYASDDGVNAANANVSQDEISFTMNGGNLFVEVGEGDTDCIDSNGNITVTGGTIQLVGQSGFDFDGTAVYTGGDITINGEKQSEIKNSMMMGPPNDARGFNHQQGMPPHDRK
ncbi:carbohydrate-binding domain-containing protein [uncultured Granulicatella sp.]|uniref:carbohydrate-binding domain-containing protein n=1 Tax=uncultured Granulicatella sp. TaxID=316089 RepID=UPI0028D34060|nr:carbohydrate-binding domain-containing protein [uncultured Granulicatella sp.]